jgi:hypothetical protein
MVRKHSLSDPSFQGSFQFSAGTSGSSLRSHLDTEHKVEYLRVHLAKGWKNELPSIKAAKSVATVSNSGSEVQPCVPFTWQSLVDHLVDFIIADDQVSTFCRCLYHADVFPLVDQRCRTSSVPQTSSSLAAGASGQ